MASYRILGFNKTDHLKTARTGNGHLLQYSYKSWRLNSGAKRTKRPLVRKTLAIAARNEVYYEKEGEDTGTYRRSLNSSKHTEVNLTLPVYASKAGKQIQSVWVSVHGFLDDTGWHGLGV